MPELRVLAPDDSERLLRRGTFGRVGMGTPHGPEVIPVNYAVVDETIVVRTSPGGVLARYADGAPLVFEVDLVDHEYWNGWSVVARGVGEVVKDPQGAGRPRIRPWADGDRTCELRLTWTELSGRQVGAAWDLDDLLRWRRSAR